MREETFDTAEDAEMEAAEPVSFGGVAEEDTTGFATAAMEEVC